MGEWFQHRPFLAEVFLLCLLCNSSFNPSRILLPEAVGPLESRRPWAVDRTSNPEQHGLPMSGSHTHRVISELERAKTQGSFGVAEEIYTSLKQNPVGIG